MGGLFSKLSLRQQLLYIAILATTVMTVQAVVGLTFEASVGTTLHIVTWLVGSVILLSLGIYAGKRINKRALTCVEAMQAMAKGDLTKRPSVPGKDEFSWLAWEYTQGVEAYTGIVTEVRSHSERLHEAAASLSSVTDATKSAVTTQRTETEGVAHAMQEMAASVQEVARNAAAAADSARHADDEAKSGREVVRTTMETINSLAGEVEHTSASIATLKEESLRIGTVLDVIRDIAEQTNLLALNAAIEAARAGEQGRGFAVVADEVRSLASRTQQSTQEIHDMIERLQSGASDAVTAMERGQASATACVEQADKASQSLDSITHMISEINRVNTQIASAAEQQSLTSEEINRNVVNISEVAQTTSEAALQTSAASEELSSLSQSLNDTAARFRLS